MYIDGIVGLGCGKNMFEHVAEKTAIENKNIIVARVLKSNQQGILAFKKNGYASFQETDQTVLMIKEI
ncbi:MAG: hypothetical protein ACXWL2_02990 [Candidatus Chromulinivorax sp.]